MVAPWTGGERMDFERDSYRTEPRTPVAAVATVPAAPTDASAARAFTLAHGVSF